ncbi:hypothetical protein HO607_04955 [Streptococcus suis]|nr:hypothetical protein [Streptococcus suis]
MINLQNFVQSMYAKRIEDCTDQELYYALLAFTKQQSEANTQLKSKIAEVQSLSTIDLS